MIQSNDTLGPKLLVAFLGFVLLVAIVLAATAPEPALMTPATAGDPVIFQGETGP